MSRKGADRPARQPIALVLLDEHPLTRVGVRNVLSAEPDISLVAETETVDQAVDACRAHQPDVVLVDVDLPPTEMVHSIRRLRDSGDQPAVVVMSHGDSDNELFQSAVAGAAGHLADMVDPGQLASMIRRAATGEEPISEALAERPEVGRRVLETFVELAAQEQAAAGHSVTDRQREILHHAARGLTNQQIGRELGTSTGTIRAELSELMRAFGMRHRTQVVVHAVREGWIDLPATGGGPREAADDDSSQPAEADSP
jgi:DNA-binding NarL/FixJ family response regulator